MRILLDKPSNSYLDLDYTKTIINDKSEFKSEQDLYSYLIRLLQKRNFFHLFDGYNTYLVNSSKVIYIDSLNNKLLYK